VLLVLDNCEHVVDAAADLVALILDKCPRVTILTTSREPLAVPGEVRLPVGPLPAPPVDADQSRFGDYAAMELLLERGRAVRPDLATRGLEAAALAEICRRLDGIPLALELAAARFNILTPSQVADRLDDRFRLLTGGARTVLPRQQTLRAVVDWSWDLLDAAERGLLEVCAVFAGGAALEDLESVAGAEVLDILGRLVSKSLAVAELRDGAMRYRLLETIREYARERLAESGREQSVRDRHAAHYAELAYFADQRLRGPDQLIWIARLDAEGDNLRAALDWAMRREDAYAALSLCSGLAWYWMLRGRRDARAALRQAIALAERVGATGGLSYCRALAADGFSAFEGGLVEEAGRSLSRSLHAYQAYGGHHTVAELSSVLLAMFDPPRLTRQMVDSDARCSAAGDDWGLAVIRMFHARVLTDEDNPAAERYARHAMELFRKCGDRWGAAECGQVLGQVESLRGHHREALAVYAQSAAFARELGTVGETTLTLVYVQSAWEHEYLGETQAADRMLAEAERTAGDGAVGEVGGFLWLARAEVARRRGDAETASRSLDRARKSVEKGFSAPFRAVFDVIAAQLAVEAGDYPAAGRYLARGLEQATEFFFDVPDVAACVETLAAVAHGLGETGRAATFLGAASAIRPLVLPPTRARDALRTTEAVRGALGAAEYERAYARGRALSKDAAHRMACADAKRYGVTDQLRRL
jgi:predicted ATPase